MQKVEEGRVRKRKQKTVEQEEEHATGWRGEERGEGEQEAE